MKTPISAYVNKIGISITSFCPFVFNPDFKCSPYSSKHCPPCTKRAKLVSSNNNIKTDTRKLSAPDKQRNLSHYCKHTKRNIYEQIRKVLLFCIHTKMWLIQLFHYTCTFLC